MSTKPRTENPLTQILMERWEQASRKLADLAEELPGEKFGSTPVTGLRNCGAILRHVAFWNQYVAASLRGQDTSDAANELPAADYPSKASVLGELRRSAGDVAAALRDHRGDLTPKTMELIVTFVEHTSEHYGQLAVYSRLMGIVPPVSRV